MDPPLWGHTPGDTAAPAKHPQCQRARELQHHFPATLSSTAQLGHPPRRVAIPAAGRAPAQLSLQHHLLLLLIPPTVAQEEKGSTERGRRRAASRGRAFFGEQSWPLSAAAARPDCTSVCCGAAAQSPSLLGEHRAISRVTSLLQSGRTRGSPLLPCCQDAKPSPPSAARAAWPKSPRQDQRQLQTASPARALLSQPPAWCLVRAMFPCCHHCPQQELLPRSPCQGREDLGAPTLGSWAASCHHVGHPVLPPALLSPNMSLPRWWQCPGSPPAALSTSCVAQATNRSTQVTPSSQWPWPQTSFNEAVKASQSRPEEALHRFILCERFLSSWQRNNLFIQHPQKV